MEGKTKSIIYTFLILIFLWSCKLNSTHSQVIKETTKSKKNDLIKKDTILCKNDPSLYSEIVPNLLYSDSLSKLYLRRKQIIQKSPLGGELSKCEKIPYGFVNTMAILNDSIVSIKDFIDTESFKKFDQTDIFFFDKNGVYVFQDSPATSPQFFEININLQKASIIDSLYLKDSKNVYWKGIKIKEANAITFTSTKLKTINGKEISLVYDKKYLYHLNKIYNVKTLNNLPFNKKRIDSLRLFFFKL